MNFIVDNFLTRPVANILHVELEDHPRKFATLSAAFCAISSIGLAFAFSNSLTTGIVTASAIGTTCVVIHLLGRRILTNPNQAPPSNPPNSQPQIVDDNWGIISIRSQSGVENFRDVVLLPGRALAWNWKWSQDSMHHHPGYRTEDFDHYLLSDKRPDVVILSRGRGYGGQKNNPGPGILEIEDRIPKYLEENGIGEVFCLKTHEAIAKYNELTANGNQRVAAFIHTTC